MSEGANPATSISLVVLTYNEEGNLPACLESVRGLGCEVFVVDSGSTDHTLEISRHYGAQVYSHPFDNYSRQRNWAQQNLPLAGDWVLHLDADERLTPELVQEINTLFRGGAPAEDGFMFRKRTLFMGRWIKHGGHYPSFHLRLFRRHRGRCEDRLYDQHFVVEGAVSVLRHDYIDVLTSDLGTWTARHNRWAELEAREILSQEKSQARVRADAFGNPIERRRWLREGFYGRWPLFLRAFLYWGYRYFLRLGFLDGKEGLIFHFLQGCWFRFLVDAKIYECRMRSAGKVSEEAAPAARWV